MLFFFISGVPTHLAHPKKSHVFFFITKNFILDSTISRKMIIAKYHSPFEKYLEAGKSQNRLSGSGDLSSLSVYPSAIREVRYFEELHSSALCELWRETKYVGPLNGISAAYRFAAFLIFGFFLFRIYTFSIRDKLWPKFRTIDFKVRYQELKIAS